MRKYLALLLAMILVFSLTACGSDEGSVQGAAQEPNDSQESAVSQPQSDNTESASPTSPYASYAGEYLCVSQISSTNGDLTGIIESGWADKSFYMYIIIDEDTDRWPFIMVTVKDGAETRDDWFLDPESLEVSPNPEFEVGKGQPVVFGEDGTLTIENKVNTLVYIKSDEIPH